MVDFPSASEPKAPRTYALIGHNFEYEDTLYTAREDVTVIRSKTGKPLSDAPAQIHGPANLVFLAHADTDGRFRWRAKDPLASLGDFFGSLPRKEMHSLVLGSCSGGMAMEAKHLKLAPPGMLVMSMVGPHHQASASVTRDFIAETIDETRPIQLYLKILDNFDPVHYARYIAHWNKTRQMTRDANPEQALPSVLGIGGKKPFMIHLDVEAAQVSSRIRDAKAEAAWGRAIARVQDAFETQHYAQYPEGSGIEDQAMMQDLGPEAEQMLDHRIAEIAGRMREGAPVQGDSPAARAEYQRISYALAAAFLDESGTLAYWQAQAKAASVGQSAVKQGIAHVSAAPETSQTGALSAPVTPAAPFTATALRQP